MRFEVAEFSAFEQGLNKVLFSFRENCPRCCDGTVNLWKDNSAPDGHIWHCSNRRCRYKVTVRKHSFFAGSHLSFATISKVIYFWAHKYPQEIVIHELQISHTTVVDFYNFCREVCSIVLERDSEPIGGPGKIVEIDESKFGKRKYNRGKRVDGCWVFGGIERDSNPPKCFFCTVTDRSAQTLIPLIKRWILPGTTVVSDCWKSYSSLSKEGYIHQTVNHSIQFVSDSGAHTNHIESRWNSLKRSLPRFGTTKDLYQSYFAEYCIRRKFLDTAQDKFLESLRLIGSVYKPSQELLSQPVANAQPQLEPQSTGTTSSATAYTFLPADVDVATFDLGFSIEEDDNNVDTLDASADLFD